ncbi:hypothetical protein CDAR_496091 [Caerostris darwini]|uniref:Uncharacterized protein n=1 Tax=Caerostris darwini TaxID=1538125 RepID=A0AAV4U210_9ARAC|nr:hypothetical protein CDAR_496091 [Caerostris darwini]
MFGTASKGFSFLKEFDHCTTPDLSPRYHTLLLSDVTTFSRRSRSPVTGEQAHETTASATTANQKAELNLHVLLSPQYSKTDDVASSIDLERGRGGGGGARVHVTGADDDVTAAESGALSQQQKGKAHRTPRATQEVLSPPKSLSRTETPRHHGRVRPAGMLSPARPRTALRPGAQGTRPDQSQGR